MLADIGQRFAMHNTQPVSNKRDEITRRFSNFGFCELRNIAPVSNRKRYYCIEIQPGLFDVTLQRQWGRIGSKPRSIRMYFADASAALVEANRLYREKLRKGYKELT